MRSPVGKPPYFEVTENIVGACIEVHRQLGPGLLESAYESCLAHELELRGVGFARQHPVVIHYKGLELGVAYRIDLVVEQRVAVELKAVQQLLPIHEAQLLTYLKLTGLAVGLLVNFHTPALRKGASAASLSLQNS